MALLGGLSRSIKDVKEMGRKFGVVEQGRQQGGKKGGFAMGVMTDEFFMGGGGMDGRVGVGVGAGGGEWM